MIIIYNFDNEDMIDVCLITESPLWFTYVDKEMSFTSSNYNPDYVKRKGVP